MEVATTRDALRRLRRDLAVSHHDKHFERPLIGLTPTMGALHAGHRALIERMADESDVSIVSIFVNPLQFGAGEDLERYPRTLDSDLQICQVAGADLVYAPPVDEVYAENFTTSVAVAELTERWCGAGRPGHFQGVTTVVAKLFNACDPDRAYFGEKDYQQLCVVQRMTRDLEFDVEIVACPTVREPDGLAISSRNQYLSASERDVAPKLHQALQRLAACFSGGVQDAESLIIEAKHVLAECRTVEFELEYLAVVDPRTLAPRERAERGDRALIAARIGSTRLIDNLALTGGEPAD
ncbi:pantoate--beta-alanine ligase [bacterium]|nr:pantoate--beta-alanine ligase [bacterium]